MSKPLIPNKLRHFGMYEGSNVPSWMIEIINNINWPIIVMEHEVPHKGGKVILKRFIKNTKKKWSGSKPTTHLSVGNLDALVKYNLVGVEERSADKTASGEWEWHYHPKHWSGWEI